MNNAKIHPTAIVSEKAKIGPDVEIGPYSIIGPHVEIGKGTIVKSNVVIEGHTSIGEHNKIYQFSSIGADPQDLSYRGEESYVKIGNNNIIREFVTIHKGTKKDNLITQIGSNCLFMAYSHVAHDVRLGDRVVVVNDVNLGGHVKIESDTVISGASNVSQKVSIGRLSFIGGMTAINKDIPPFCTAYGNRCTLKGINIIGLKRNGVPTTDISQTVDFYRSLEASSLSPRSFTNDKSLMEEYAKNPIIDELVEFIQESSLGIAPFL